jgi:hypothetical protein
MTKTAVRPTAPRLSYSAADRSTWEPQIRTVQDATFAADGIVVEHHDREAAFHRAMSIVGKELAASARYTSGEPLISERRVIAIAVRTARTRSGARSRWFYLGAAAAVAAAVALTATVVWRLNWILNWVVIERPPREQQVQGGAVLERVVSYGGWAVGLVSALMTALVLLDVALAVASYYSRRDRLTVNGYVAAARGKAVGSLLVTAGALFVLAVAIGSIEWVGP